jgi:sigma-B regulation protein RsbU (phosphoserine phosphatase)
MRIKPRSLQRQTLFFILAPIFLLLVCLSIAGYIFVRTVLLNQWGETAITKLQRTAHQVDMRLRKPKDLLLLLHSRKGDGVNREILSYILQEIKNLNGVVGAKVDWKANSFAHNSNSSKHESMMGRMRIYQLEQLTVSSPTYNSKENNRIISLESELKDKDGNPIGKTEIVISFDNLINEIIKASWWKTNKAYFIDDSGNVLADTSTESSLDRKSPMTTFGSADLLESDTLKAMEDNLFGTVFGPGSPPKEISGFYRLSEAPWTLVVIAPGEKILQSV